MPPVTRRHLVLLASACAVRLDAATTRVVAIGDVHGDIDALLDVLRMAGLIDPRRRWSGGAAALVQLGDMVGGAGSRAVLDLLMRLEKDAAKAGGRVVCLLGNHEAARLSTDFDGVGAEEYKSFTTKNSDQAREKLYMQQLASLDAAGEIRNRPDQRLGYRQRWEQSHPLGEAELRAAYSATGVYGRWLLGCPTVAKLGGTLFSHAGIAPEYLAWSAERINERMREDLTRGTSEGAFWMDPWSPLRYRAFAQAPEAEIAAQVERLLEMHGVRRLVVGHTPQPNGIVSRLGGKLILADTGISERKGGRRACLVIEDGTLYALEEGRRAELSAFQAR